MVRKKFEPNKEELTPASNGRDNDRLLKNNNFPNDKTPTIVKDADEIHELLPVVNEKDEIHVEEHVGPKAPDGGYGWVIVVASFFCNFIVDGVAYSFSVYLLEWTRTFPDDGEGKISLIGSLLNGVYLCMGPISSALTNAFGFRVVIFSGALIATIAFVASAFCRTVNALIAVFGVLGGIGFGLIYSPSILCVCYYFEKKRALAVGICVCGSGVGAFVFPPLISMTVGHFGWPGSMMILAGLVLQVCVAGAFMKNLEVSVEDKVEIRGTREEAAPMLTETTRKVVTTETYVRDSIPPLARAESLGKPGSNFRDLKHVKPPRLRNRSESEPGSEGDVVYSRRYSSAHGLDVKTMEKGRVQHRTVTGPHRHYFSTPDISQDVTRIRHTQIARPFDNKTIVVQGSLKHLNRSAQEKYEAEVFRRASQTSLPRKTVVETTTTTTVVTPASVEPPKKSFLPEPLRQALRELSDFRIYTNPVFLIFSVASFLGMIAFYIPFMFVPKFAIVNGLTENTDTSQYLISAIGLTNIFGRLFWGWLSDRPRMDPLIIHNCCIVLVGILLGFVPVIGQSGSFVFLMIACAIFGFFVSPFISLLSIILTSRIPLSLLPSAFGQSQLVRGVASMIGSPIGGMLYEARNSYTMTFLVSGAEFIIAAVIASLILVMEFIRRRGRRSGQETNRVLA